MIRVLTEGAAASGVGVLLAVLACGWLLAAGIWLSVIDIRSHLLPNRIVYPSIAVAFIALGLAALLLGGAGMLLRTWAGGVILGAAYLLLRVIYPAGMGLGDVKLAVALGAYLGFVDWWHLFYGTFFAFLLGGLLSLVLIALRRANRHTALPFGPFMLAGAVLALLLP